MEQKQGYGGARVVKSLCPMCATHCGINVHIRDNTVIKITPMREHPLKNLCVKSTGIPDMQHSKDRLLYPMRKVNGNFKMISWEEAMEFIIGKLEQIKEKHGPEALALIMGHGLFNKESIGLIRIFAEAFGTPNICSAGPLCEWPRAVGHTITFGASAWHDIGRAGLILEWGIDGWNSTTPARALYNRMKKSGQKLVVIDPRRTHNAKMADLHLRIKPGTDHALMLAFMNVIIGEDLYDHAFVEKWTIGFDRLKEAVKAYTPEWAEEITRIPADQTREVARMYATIKPASFATFVPLQQSSNAFHNLRSSAILMAITGNVDVPGGNRLISHPPDILAWPHHAEGYQPKTQTFTGERWPLFEKVIKEAVANCLWDTIVTEQPYPVKGLIIQGGNMGVTFPDSNRFKEAAKNLDLFVVMDLFMTETAKEADIVLPAATSLECRWSHSYIWALMPLVCIPAPAFEPSGECWADSKFWIELGRRMGFEAAFPWKDTDELLEETLLKPFDKTFEWLEENPRGFFYAPKEYGKYEKDGFATPSGKVEIYSQTLEDMGLPPLPVPYDEPLESSVSTPEVFKEYPLMAITGKRYEEYEHSCWRNLPKLRKRRPDPELEIHPNDAFDKGLKNGEWAVIESPRGQAEMKVKITEDTMEGVITMPHGWSGHGNVNLLTSN